ncbi:MAG: polysaccharide deacetylase family protein [Oscillospiraceae bacterium]|jgi:hypothetical protein|nr:polysaccharide deacetylase family protein [Oscillospiraceae bacterium]
MAKTYRRIAAVFAVIALTASLAACGAAQKDTSPEATPEPEPTPTPEIIAHVVNTPTPAPPAEAAPLVPWDGTVEHLFFHPVVAYPELAFDGDGDEKGIDDWMVTADEYKKMLQSIYDNGYIIVDMNDVWSEYTDGGGKQRMERNTLMVPEGKKPLILSYDDVNYYDYMLPNGFTHRLMIGKDGQIWSYGRDMEGNAVISQDLDALTILDKFVSEHPDFSLNGAKGCLCLTGYQGILGYRTQTDSKDSSPEFEANRQREIVRVKPIVEKLKATGWYFGSHTWGHIRLSTMSLDGVKKDTEKWQAEVASIVGNTTLLFYPHGARPDGDDWQKTGERFAYLQSQGFRVFASVGIESFSYIKKDVCAVICDRLHADGTTLRGERDSYMKFYDAAEVWDDRRPTGGQYDADKKW